MEVTTQRLKFQPPKITHRIAIDPAIPFLDRLPKGIASRDRLDICTPHSEQQDSQESKVEAGNFPGGPVAKTTLLPTQGARV